MELSLVFMQVQDECPLFQSSYCEWLMSEGPKRHSTRERRPPKFRQMTDTEYGLYSEGRPAEPKDPAANAQENKQLALLLVKFIASSNSKLRDLQREDRPQPQVRPGETVSDETSRPALSKPRGSRNDLVPSEVQASGGRHPGDGDRAGGEGSRGGPRPYVKRNEQGRRAPSGLPASIAVDMTYHAMLGQHIRSNLPDSQNLCPQKLMQLGLPSSELLEQTKPKDPERKKRPNTGESRGNRELRDEMKPFKRQSYHVAIAYHIFLKQVKSGAGTNPRDIDPTYHARRLREQNQPPT